MQADFLNTLFALFFAIVLVAAVWSLVLYFAELGSEEAKRHNKALIIASVSWLAVMMALFAVVEWIRGAVGF